MAAGAGTPVFKMGIHRAQRFLHGAWLPAVAAGYTRAIPLRLVVLADGAFDTLGLWHGLPAHGTLIVRTAKNRRLRHLPELTPSRGRPRKYGPEAPRPQSWLRKRKGFQKTVVAVRGRSFELRYRVLGPYLREQAPDRPLFLLVVGGATWRAGKRKPMRARRDPAFYLVNAEAHGPGWTLPLSAPLILAWIW